LSLQRTAAGRCEFREVPGVAGMALTTKQIRIGATRRSYGSCAGIYKHVPGKLKFMNAIADPAP
jgi:hypothetical protein